MAPRRRNKENRPYPGNWRVRQKGGNYYISFRVPKSARHLWGGKAEPQLGKGASMAEAEREAYQTWQSKIAMADTPNTMGAAFDRYEAEVVPAKSPASQKSNHYSLKRLRKVVPASMPVVLFETHHAYQYRDQCAQLESPKKANLDIEVLSHLFTKCLEWGTPGLREHPIRGKMRKLPAGTRDRYVNDNELAAFLATAGPMINAYVPLKYALGIDKSLMLRIRMADIKDDRLLVQKRTKIKNNSKAKPKEYPFFDRDGVSTGLLEIIENVKAWRKKHVKVLSPWLFCTSHGKPYIKEDGTTSGFDSIWQRAMGRALDPKTGKLKSRFTEHDICAKSASDTETLEEAAKLRGHLNPATTERVYRRKPNKVMPLNRKLADEEQANDK